MAEKQVPGAFKGAGGFFPWSLFLDLRKFTANLDFGNEDDYVTVFVPFPTLVAGDTITVSVTNSEDHAVQGVVVGVLSQEPGVGFTIYGLAPDRASGLCPVAGHIA